MAEDRSVLVGIPLGYGGIPPETSESLIRACSGWAIKTRTGRTDLNRNYLCQAALDGEYEYIVMLDVDHMHPADTVERLYQRAQADKRRQVVAALCFSRQEPYKPLAWVERGDKCERIGAWERALVKVRWVGTGAILIATEALRQIGPPWFVYLYDEAAHAYPSEDIAFCEKCAKAGVTVWLDPTLSPPHLGRILVDEALYRAYERGRNGSRS
ncbi:MAG TPA: hypothetical protein PK406_00640 [Verrucomicrobiota bacterium]|nr:hypothetical protein [Verrucomicrobiota bacterium]